jgi:hypothetical protein
VLKYKDLVNAPGKRAFIYRWIGYKVRYFGCWIGVMGSKILRKGREEVEREIDLNKGE